MKLPILIKWVKLILLLLIVSFALFFLTDILFMVLTSVGHPDELSVPVSSAIEPPPIDTAALIQNTIKNEKNTILNREANLTITPSNISCEYILDVPVSSGLAQGISDGMPNIDVYSFVSIVFGEIQKADLKPSSLFEKNDFDPPTWTLDSKTNILHLRISAHKSTSNQSIVLEILPANTNLDISSDQVSMKVQGFRLTYVSPINNLDVTPDQIVVKAQDQPLEQMYLVFAVNPNENTNSQSITKQNSSRQQFLQNLGDWPSFPFVSDIISAFREALPILLFLIIIKKYTTKIKLHILPVFVHTLEALLIFHFTTNYIVGWAKLFQLAPINSGLSNILSPVISKYFIIFVNPIFGDGPYYFGIVIFGVLLPSILFCWWKTNEENRQNEPNYISLLSIVILWLPFIGITVYCIYYLGEQGYLSALSFVNKYIPLWILTLFYASLIGAIIFVLTRMLQKRFVFKDNRMIITALSTWLLILIGIIKADQYIGSSFRIPSSVLWLILDVLLGAVLILALTSIVLGAIQRILPKLELPSIKSKRWWVLGGIIAIPMRSLVIPSSPVASGIDILNLAFGLDNLIFFVWFAGVVWILYRLGRRSLQVDMFTREIGILAAASILFSITSRWFYIPITFLLGWLLLKWIIQPALYWENLAPLHNLVVKRRNELLEKIINLNSAETAHWDYRKKMSERLADGKITPKGFDRELKRRRLQLDNLQNNSKIEDQIPKDVALAFGPFDTAWHNALHAAKWAAIFALPWFILYFRDFLASTTYSDTYPLISIVTDVVYIFSRWVGIGFFFGYFYPYFRGRTGTQKGLGLFCVLFLATLPIALIFRSTASSWQAILFWGLQIFIECLLLGLIAFDYWTIRIGKRGWQMLFEVQGLTSIGISVSTILAAISVAVATLLTTQASNIVGLTLKLFLPNLPSDILPK